MDICILDKLVGPWSNGFIKAGAEPDFFIFFFGGASLVLVQPFVN